MTAPFPSAVATAIEGHDAFTVPDEASWEPFADGPLVTIRTIQFDAALTAVETADGSVQYEVAISLPMLSAATSDGVGPAVEAGWAETLERRLADAPMATREALELDSFSLQTGEIRAVARFTYRFDDPPRAIAIAKTLAEYVEGTYVEGIVPGYEYDEPVASLLARAGSGEGDGGRGPTPL